VDPESLAREEAVIALCGPCRHFEQSLRGAHTCGLGLPLLDGVTHTGCASFDPFAVGEGSDLRLLGGDCCRKHGHAEG